MSSQLPMLLGGAKNGLPTLKSGANPLLQTLRRTNPTGASYIFDTIDTYTLAKPLREAIVGRPNATGRDMLKQAGLVTGDGRIDVPLGIAAEMAFDPTTWMSGGVSAAGKAGRAARAAGLIDDAPRLFSRAALKAGKADDLVKPVSTWSERIFNSPLGLDSVGTRANKTYKKAGISLNKLTDSDLAARPLVGKRQAMRDPMPGTNRSMTLNDLVQAAPNPGKSMDDVTDFLGKGNVQGVINNPVFKDLQVFPGLPGVNLPFGVGDTIAHTLDRAGDAARHSGLGRHLASAVDKSVLGRSDDVEQLIAKRLTNTEGIKKTEATKRISELFRSVDSDLIDLIRVGDNGRYLRAAVEGNEKFLESLLKNTDQLKVLKNHRQFDTLVQGMKKFYKGYLDESAEAGIKSASLTDEFGNDYFSRRLDRKLYPDPKSGGIKINESSVITGDMQQRSPEFNIPGGTGMLNQLSRDLAGNADLREGSKLKDHIMARVKEADAVLPVRPPKPVEVPVKGKGGQTVIDPSTGKPLTQTVMKDVTYTEGKAKELANKLLNMDKVALKDGVRLFDENPFEAVEKYAMGRSKAIGRANELQSLIAQTASKKGNGTSVKGALDKFGMESTYGNPLNADRYRSKGAKQNVVDSINSLSKKGVIGNISELGNWKTNIELQKRISNVAEFYDDVDKQSDFFKTLSSITKNFKVWVLATPRRSVRDWYSGMFSNIITHPSVPDQVYGYGIAKRAVIEQDWEGARTLLEKIPRYERIKASGGDVIRAAQDDLALVDMSQTGKLRDIDPSGQLLDSEPEVFAKYLGGDGKAETTAGYRMWDNTIGQLTGSANPNVTWKKNSSIREMKLKNLSKDITPFDEGFRDTVKNAFMEGEMPTARKEYTNIQNPYLRTTSRTAEVTDKINRMGGYFAMLKGGYSPEAAAKAITEAQIDYGSLTQFERKFLQGTLFPFWAYQSRVVKWGLKTMSTKPTFKNIALRAPQRLGESLGDEDNVAPSRIAERYGIPMPDFIPEWAEPYIEPLLGKEIPGADIWLSDIDIPLVDSLNTISPVIGPETNVFGENPLSITKTAGGTAQNIAGSMLNPLAKMGVEIASGKDLFTKTPLDATRRSAATVAGRMGLQETGQEIIGTLEPLATTVAPGLNHLLSAARKISTPTVADGGKSPSVAQNALETAINLGSGFKVERIGDEERLRDMRQKIADFLEQSPMARSMSIPYIPKDKLDRVSPEIQQLFELDKQLQRQSRALRDARVSNNPLLTP